MDPFPHFRQQLSHVSQLAAAGIDKDALRQLYGEQLVHRVRRGVYSPAPLPPRGQYLLSNGRVDLGYLAQVRAVLLELSDRAVVGGRTAAVLWGFDLAVEPDAVEVAVPPGGARSRAVTRAQLAAAVRAQHGNPHYRRLRKVLAWSDEHSGSVLESLFRVLMLEAGVVRPRSQYKIPKVGRVDFYWDGCRLVVELDGRRWHDPEDARNNDRRRGNDLTLGSFRLLRYTWADVVHRPEAVVAEVQQALEGWLAVA